MKVMLVFGTRPEAIKMCPVVKALRRHQDIETIVCVTGQHREMLEQVLQVFEVRPEYDLAIMKENQTLFDITTAILVSGCAATGETGHYFGAWRHNNSFCGSSCRFLHEYTGGACGSGTADL